MMNKDILKKYSPYLIAVVAFLLLAIIYCSPMLEGKVVQPGDIKSWEGMYQEAKEYKDQTGKTTYWTGSMFSGMPTYQIGGSDLKSDSWLLPIKNLLRLGLPELLFIIFGYFIGFFVLLRSFKINTWICIIGATAIAFSSYFFIILEAGHFSKAKTLGMMAPVIGGFFLTYNKKYMWGTAITLIFMPISFMYHPQMSYYIFMLIGILFVTELYIHLKSKQIKDFFIASAIFFAAIGISIGTQYVHIKTNNEYVKETMRGGHSELKKATDSQNKTTGLDLDYATNWSYGIDETMTLLIPNFMGASSHYNVGKNSGVYDALIQNGVPKNNAEDFCKSVPVYWGNQPFTSGPVYAGAIIIFLFVLGLMLVKGPYKWALLVATVFSIMLAWGKNFMPLTELFFNYFPMYNKFRAVSSILIVAEITIPLLGFLGIKAIMDKSLTKQEILKSIKISTYITGGLCLFFALFGGMFCSFTSVNDAATFSQLPPWLGSAIIDERASMLRSDSIRSLIFIVLGAGILWAFVQEKVKFYPFVLVLGALILVDMWGVDKRFLNNDSFVTQQNSSNYFRKEAYEEAILKDKDPHFRVFNLTRNTFNDSRTSYYFKSIGGYHAAKLRRYQDLIDVYLSKMNLKVLSMLNAKYIIVPGNDRKPVAQLNSEALGNAWFVDSVVITNTPNEEIEALDRINLKNTAVTDQKFASFVQGFTPGTNENAQVKFVSYAPNELKYEIESDKSGLVVFSEIYYPYGWKAYIDEKPVEHFRANYTLRALNVPAGQHSIRFVFQPDVVYKNANISLMFVILIYASLLGFIVYAFMKRKKTL